MTVHSPVLAGTTHSGMAPVPYLAGSKHPPAPRTSGQAPDCSDGGRKTLLDETHKVLCLPSRRVSTLHAFTPSLTQERERFGYHTT